MRKWENFKIKNLVPINESSFYKDYYDNQIQTHNNKLIIHSKFQTSKQKKDNIKTSSWD